MRSPTYSEGHPQEPLWTWLIIDQVQNMLIGDAGFISTPDKDGNIVPEQRNQGYATEAVHALIAWTFQQPDITAVIARTLSNNEPSIKVLTHVGMSYVKTEDDYITWRFIKFAE